MSVRDFGLEQQLLRLPCCLPRPPSAPCKDAAAHMLVHAQYNIGTVQLPESVRYKRYKTGYVVNYETGYVVNQEIMTSDDIRCL
jgi:hypothetical protein